MELTEAIKYYGKNVRVTCVDGGILSGMLGGYQTFADEPDEPDEPESIAIYIEDYAVDIPVVEIAAMVLNRQYSDW